VEVVAVAVAVINTPKSPFFMILSLFKAYPVCTKISVHHKNKKMERLLPLPATAVPSTMNPDN